MTRELLSLSNGVVRLAAQLSSTAEPKEVEAILWDLFNHNFRGITLAVYGLAWHGLGVPTLHPDKAALILSVLRERGTPMSLRDLQRKPRLTPASLRDTVLKDLQDENLVILNGKTVTAVLYPDFVEKLYRRKDLPPPVCLSQYVAELPPS